MRLYLFEWNGVSKVARGTRHAVVFRSIIVKRVTHLLCSLTEEGIMKKTQREKRENVE